MSIQGRSISVRQWDPAERIFGRILRRMVCVFQDNFDVEGFFSDQVDLCMRLFLGLSHEY